MAATQVGVGSLTLGAPLTAGAVFVTIPTGAIVESVAVEKPGDAQMETQYDADGAAHTDIWYEKRCWGATVVIVGRDFTALPGTTTGAGGKYEIMSVAKEHGKGPIRSTVTVKRINFT
jgi:hypothetical protein